MNPLLRKRLRVFRRNKGAVTGAVLLVLLTLGVTFAPLLSPRSPFERDATLQAPGGPHVLGTDDQGRDILSRILHGGRISLFIGFISVGISLSVGGTIGLLTGYAGGKVDLIFMRAMDILLAFPSILLAILIVNMLDRPGLSSAMIAVGVVGVPVYARLMRASVLAEKSRDYVTASVACGASPVRVAVSHILPNVVAPILVQVTLGFGSAILDAAGLSFLGLGAQDPQIEWGLMINQARSLYSTAWWIILFPGLAIFVSVLGFNLVGDGLREALDPRTGS